MVHAKNIKGFDNVMKNLNKEIKAIKDRTQAGLIQATIIVRRSTEKTEPLTPVDTGNLRASWFTNSPSVVTSVRPSVDMGYSANYAIYVHEMIDKKINWTRTGSGPKWFEIHVKEETGNILQTIKKHAEIR
jgi:hypothetical protein